MSKKQKFEIEYNKDLQAIDWWYRGAVMDGFDPIEMWAVKAALENSAYERFDAASDVYFRKKMIRSGYKMPIKGTQSPQNCGDRKHEVVS
jgi:hypothetical protein